MPKESAIFIIGFCMLLGVLWNMFASISVVDRQMPAITSVMGAATWLVLWPGYLTWVSTAFLVTNGIFLPSIWVIIVLVGLTIGGVLGLAGFYWATRA